MPGTAATLAVGETVGAGYEILGLAGSGGMGVVYQARDLKLGRKVALKFLPPELNANEHDKQRFLREARTASSLDHPNIGVIHGIEETSDGRTFIVMAFYEGASLADELRAHPVTPHRAVEIAIQIAHGLAEAHAHQVIHRDIKPSNVMLTSSGSVRIVDFGLAHVMDARTASQSGITGTYSYMSPEQASEGAIDPRTDIWALGIILAEMVTGRNPFERATFAGTLLAILNERPTGIETQHPGLQHVIYRALAKQPESRYQDCSELLEDLEALLPLLADEPAAGSSSMPVQRANSSRAASSQSRSTAKMRQAIKEASRKSYMGDVQPAVTWRPWTLGLLALLLVAGAALWFTFMRGRKSAADTEAGALASKHIAVLPFDNIGNNPENAVLVDGLMDSLAGKLSNLEVGDQSLWVVPTSEIRRRKIVDAEDALKGLGANLAVKGSVQRDGKIVRLNVNLIDASRMRLIGSAQLEDQGGDLSTMEDEAVSRLARLMKITLSADELRNTGGSVNPAAYEGYLTALGYMQRWDKAGNLDLAIKALKESVGTDPRFALGYAQLGEAYRLKYKLQPNTQWLIEAEANGRKAAELDDRLPSVYVTLGRIHQTTGKRDLALQEFQHALDIDPRDAAALGGLGSAYEDAGRTADAETAYAKAAALRSEDWDGFNNLANFYHRQGKYKQAIANYQHALQLTPDNAQVLLNLGAVQLESGDAGAYPQAEQALKKSIALAPTYPAYSNLGLLYTVEQRYAEAATATEEALRIDDRDYTVWSNLLGDYRWLKDDAKAEGARRRMAPLVEAAVRNNPQDAAAQSTLAVLHAMAREKDKALAGVNTALALAPDDIQVLAAVADVYELLGDRTLAVEYLQKALQKGLAPDQVRTDSDLAVLLQDPKIRLGQK